jgi:hypothetical protein
MSRKESLRYISKDIFARHSVKGWGCNFQAKMFTEATENTLINTLYWMFSLMVDYHIAWKECISTNASRRKGLGRMCIQGREKQGLHIPATGAFHTEIWGLKRLNEGVLIFLGFLTAKPKFPALIVQLHFMMEGTGRCKLGYHRIPVACGR